MSVHALSRTTPARNAPAPLLAVTRPWGRQDGAESSVASGTARYAFADLVVQAGLAEQIQPRLLAGEPGDRYEQEAERAADAVVGVAEPVAPVTPWPRHTEGSSEQDKELSLPAEQRQFYESRFGHDFGAVSIHTGQRAAAAAEAVGAQAFAQGQALYFGAGYYRPDTKSGRRLIAHELAHTLQQRPPGVIARQAETASTAPEGTGSAMDALIERAAIAVAAATRRVLPVAIPETILAALLAAEAAFVERGFRRLVAQGEWLTVAGRVRELASPSVARDFAVQYVWGVLKGLISPIIGLVDLSVAGVQFSLASASWALEHAKQLPGLVGEAQALQQEFASFGATARARLQSMKSQEGLLEFAGAVFAAASSAGEALERQLVRMARQKGGGAADSLVNELRQRPLPQLAHMTGEIVGTVVIELVMLVFTDGIGNLISKLGEFARALRPLSRGVVAFTEVVMNVGRAAAELEHLIGLVMRKTALRPLMPLLEALEPLLGRIRQFVRRVLGLADEAAGGVARAGTRALEAGAGDAARTTERAAASTPNAPQPLPRPTGTVTRETTAVPTQSQRVTPLPPEPPVPRVPPSGGPTPPPRVRGASAEGVGDEFTYRYHQESRTPAVESRRVGGGSRAQGSSQPIEQPTAGAHDTRSSSGHAPDEPVLDPETEQMLSGSRTADDEVLVDPDELAELSTRYEGDRFEPAMTEEDLALVVQERFPKYRYDPPARGKEVFFGGKPYKGGRRPAGSTVPDLYIRAPGRPPISLEAKNVFVGTPEAWEDFMLKTHRQARQRAAALPRTAQQHIVIDFRGQDVTREFAEGLRRELATRSGGILRPDRIHFLPPSLD